MKARLLQQYLGTEYTIHENDNGIHVGSAYISELITIDKKGKSIHGASGRARRDMRHDEVKRIWDELETLIASGDIQHYIDGEDTLETELSVFYHDGRQIIETTTDKYGWPNVTVSGLLMYENTFYKTRVEAEERLKKTTLSWQKHLREMIQKNNREIRQWSQGLKECDEILIDLAVPVVMEAD